MPKSRQQSNQRAKWGTPAKRRKAVKGNGIRSPAPTRIVGKEKMRDATVLVNHIRTLYQTANPHLSALQINLMIAHQLGIIKKK